MGNIDNRTYYLIKVTLIIHKYNIIEKHPDTGNNSHHTKFFEAGSLPLLHYVFDR